MSIIDEVVGNVFEAFTGRSNDSLLPSSDASAADILREHVGELTVAVGHVSSVVDFMVAEAPVRQERVGNVAGIADAILAPDLVPRPDATPTSITEDFSADLATVLSLEEVRERRLAKQSLGHENNTVDAARALVALKTSDEARLAERVAPVVSPDVARDERMKLQAKGHVNSSVDTARDKVQEVLNRLGQAAA